MQIRLPNGQMAYAEDYSCIIQPQNNKGGIYIGNLESAQNLKTLQKHNIRAVLTAAKGINLNHSKADIPFYLQVPGEDRDGFDMTRFFNQGVDFIRNALQNTNVMVHCLAGVSRSVCLVLAYLIKCRGFSYDEAYSLAKMKRNIIHPNDGFISQLRKYESQVRKSPISPSLFQGSTSPRKYQKYEPFSPVKKKYDYYNDEKSINNPERNSISQYYISPSKKSALQTSYLVHESPLQKRNQYIATESHESPNKILYSSPRHHHARNASQYDPGVGLNNMSLRKIGSYNQRNSFKFEETSQNLSPERRRHHHYHREHKGRTNSFMQFRERTQKDFQLNPYNKQHRNEDPNTSLKQDLDKKIQSIRQKYCQLKTTISFQHRIPGNRDQSQSQSRISNSNYNYNYNYNSNSNSNYNYNSNQNQSFPHKYKARQDIFGIDPWLVESEDEDKQNRFI